MLSDVKNAKNAEGKEDVGGNRGKGGKEGKEEEIRSWLACQTPRRTGRSPSWSLYRSIKARDCAIAACATAHNSTNGLDALE